MQCFLSQPASTQHNAIVETSAGFLLEPASDVMHVILYKEGHKYLHIYILRRTLTDKQFDSVM